MEEVMGTQRGRKEEVMKERKKSTRKGEEEA